MAKNLLRHFLKSTRYELAERQQRLPAATFDNIRLALTFFLQTKPGATLVQIGANDGAMDDPVGEFIRLGKMKAVLVEPVPAAFEKLGQTYAGIPGVNLVQAAIGTADGHAAIYKVRLGSPSDAVGASGWASFDKAHLKKHKVRDQDIEEIKVPCLTLKSLLEKYQVAKVDVLQIDTEGFDAEIVQMALDLPLPPDCINFENIHLSLDTKNRLFTHLGARGYVWSHDKYNTLALHRSFTDRLTKAGFQ